MKTFARENNSNGMVGALPLPEGFRHVADLVTEEEECALLAALTGVELGPVRMHGVVARRRVAHFGWTYGYLGRGVSPGVPLTPELVALRDRAARLAWLVPVEFEEVLVTYYPPGAGIGWHRDAPQFGPTVIGVSLGGSCRFELRRRGETRTIHLAPGRPTSSRVRRGPSGSTRSRRSPGAGGR